MVVVVAVVFLMETEENIILPSQNSSKLPGIRSRFQALAGGLR